MTEDLHAKLDCVGTLTFHELEQLVNLYATIIDNTANRVVLAGPEVVFDDGMAAQCVALRLLAREAGSMAAAAERLAHALSTATRADP